MNPSACNEHPQELIRSDQKYNPVRRRNVYRTTKSSSIVYSQAMAVQAARTQYSGRKPQSVLPYGEEDVQKFTDEQDHREEHRSHR